MDNVVGSDGIFFIVHFRQQNYILNDIRLTKWYAMYCMSVHSYIGDQENEWHNLARMNAHIHTNQIFFFIDYLLDETKVDCIISIYMKAQVRNSHSHQYCPSAMVLCISFCIEML